MDKKLSSLVVSLAKAVDLLHNVAKSMERENAVVNSCLFCCAYHDKTSGEVVHEDMCDLIQIQKYLKHWPEPKENISDEYRAA